MNRLKKTFGKLKQWFLYIVISRFAPDYEKIKAENKELKQDIYNLIRKENWAESIAVESRWKMVFDTNDMIMLGNATNTDGKFQGFFSQISTKPNCS